MKALLAAAARRFGYEFRKIPAPPSQALASFINAPEAPFEPDFAEAACPEIFAGDGIAPDPAQASRSLIVEGWRRVPHSYAMVNQWQLLSLSRRTDVALKVVDAPLYRSNWEAQKGIFEPSAEQRLESLACAAPDERADVTLRISFPFDFTPSASRQTAIFGTSESQVFRREQCSDYRTYQQFQRGLGPLSDVKAVTPSRWSAEGFYKSGFRTDQVIVVPHGTDTGTFRPMPDLRASVRRALSIAEGDFVFLSVGAITGSKGIELLVRAFAEVSRKFPHALLVLKGLDPFYQSRGRLLRIVEKLSARDQERVVTRIKYFGQSFSNRKMALLYQVADAYVSPYLAEGFNIPVLEAASCGVPIICTGGGATDDFVTDAFARKIESTRCTQTEDGQEAAWLEPKRDHLIALMIAAIEDRDWRLRAGKAGPLHVEAHYTWDRVVETLIEKLWR